MTRNDTIRSRFHAGEAVKDIAADLEVSVSTVYAALRAQSPRKGDRAAHRTLHIRVTDYEMHALDRAVAQTKGLNRSAFLRRLIRMAADMPAATPEEEAFYASVERHLIALGGNFNQIAFALSASLNKTGKANPHKKQIETILAAHDEALKALSGIRRVMRNSQMRNARHIALMASDAPESEDGDGWS